MAVVGLGGWARSALLALALLPLGCGLLTASDEPLSEPPAAEPAAAAALTTSSPAAPTSPGAATDATALADDAVAAGSARPATRIERVTIEGAPPTTRVVLQLDGSAEPEVSLLVNHRLVVDVPGASADALPRVIDGGGDPLVQRVRTGQHAEPERKARVVIDLRDRADFSVRRQGRRIVVFLAPADLAADATAAAGAPRARVLFGAEPGGVPGDSSGAAGTEPVARVEQVVDATPAPLIALPDATPAPVLAVAEPTAAPVVGVAEATPAPAPPARDAPSDAAPSAVADARLDAPTADAEPMVEATRSPAARGETKRVSIDFTEADVRTVIDLIAAAGGYRVIFTPDVTGSVTISLVDRPWEDALQTVLAARGLREVRHEDVMLVSPVARTSSSGAR